MKNYTCTICGKTIHWYPSRVRKYCSRACLAIGYKKVVPWNKGLTKDTDERVRLRGIKHSETMHSRIKAGLIKFNYGSDHHCWQGGRSREDYSWEFTDKLKDEIRVRDNCTCQNCGMVEEEHLIVYGRSLDVHHINYNKDDCRRENLISLCIQCNVRANYNRALWQEKFTAAVMLK